MKCSICKKDMKKFYAKIDLDFGRKVEHYCKKCYTKKRQNEIL